MLFVTNLRWNSCTTQNSKMHALFRLYFLCYILIYNLEVSFNFHSTFLQLNVIKKFTVQLKLVFPLLPAICFKLPITQTFFDFPWGFELLGIDCTTIRSFTNLVISRVSWQITLKLRRGQECIISDLSTRFCCFLELLVLLSFHCP